MLFPISGVEISPVVPVAVGFLVAALTTPVGVSGAFLLLPFQVSVLGFAGPGVTPTNLLFNVFSTPGAIMGHRRHVAVDRGLVGAIIAGAVPGILVGSLLRVTVFAQPETFKAFVGATLIALGIPLFTWAPCRGPRSQPLETVSRWPIALVGLVAGIVGGIYGISGGSIIAPTLVGIFGLSVVRVAPAALIATFITSTAGVASFLLLDAASVGADANAGPDWLLALLFGIGGAAGGLLGARWNRKVPERALRRLLGGLATLLGVSYILPLI